jgi:uncharacterized membrane protein YfcA
VLWILPPREGIPLLMLLSACSQIFSIAQLRTSMPTLHSWWPQGPAPCILTGYLGMPAGLWLLSNLNGNLLCFLIGLLIMAYSFWMILAPSMIRPWRRTLSSALSVGLIGGVVGGFCGSPGIAMVIWSNLLGLDKEQKRATVQPYILAMQLMALLVFVIRGGVFSGCLLIIWVCSFSVILITTTIGVTAFRRLSNLGYNRLVMTILTLSGISLIVKGWGYSSGIMEKIDHLILLHL